MVADEDRESGEFKLVPAAVSQVRASVSGAMLHVGDLKQAALFKSVTSL